MTSHVVVVDDQEMVRAGLRMVINAEQDLEVVGEAADGVEALRVVAEQPTDVVLMDIRMPRMDGLAAASRIIGEHPQARVVMLTTFDEDHYLYEALQVGASGFVLKSSPPELLVAAIRTVAEGNALIDPVVTRRVIEGFARRAPAPPPPELTSLTAREHEVLLHLARGRSNQEIASALVVEETTVKTHVARVLMKLGLRDRIQVVIFAYEHGVVTPSHPVGGPEDPLRD